MNAAQIKHTLVQGLWEQNPGVIQLLGLCPLLAVTTTLQNGFILGIASLLTVTLSCLLVSLLRRYISMALRLPISIVIIAMIVGNIDLWMAATLPDQHQVLGLFVPLIITNCAILARAEAFALHHPPLHATLDGLATGLGFTAVLCVLGAFRELLTHGHLGAVSETPLFLLAATPAGAFFSLAVLIALLQFVKAHRVTNGMTHGAADATITPATK